MEPYTDPISNTNVSEGSVQRHTDLWFEDGNIVIQAEQTVYKLHRSILCRNSPLFADTLSLPQSAELEADESYDGHPILRLQETADDMSVFLQALLDPNFLEERCDVEDHTTLLLLSVKYQTRHLLRRVMVTLQHHFPSTLQLRDHWAHHQNILDDGFMPTDVLSCCLDLSRHRCQVHRHSYDLVKLVNAARTTGMLVLLPAAFHIACMVPLERIASTRCFDGMLPINRETVVFGQQRLARLAQETTYKILFSNERHLSPLCQDPLSCHLLRHSLIKRLESDPCGFVRPFKAPNTFLKYDAVTKLCGPCRAELTSSHIQGRKEAWILLPSIFDLPCWSEMVNARNEMMYGSGDGDDDSLVFSSTYR